ncbi:tRNA (guanosine(46)-N7)-methyltransferase TrmB [Sutcliffiella cohnii]|uniref:tRNA (guanine-N(7)-)-methyltransferase n=1 Tax=Sutcliffiella cohnii TaxID=33932 RepID=A0A223KTU8_9BACI|nr:MULTISPECIES: tRNA (guanosine(46)-N7)-methyltransferase TrmB [Sutcliffiella]AST92900.1 tRNA (guanosine(46)-N7)-methyltransferase TrmB [Sutcliffiella cohnii]MED4016142.1 tRNA (guanosine(46)-N7)-methyltransferase TrmB [Sutcliffiella cohnii]WBL14158.1 tRNA (guanosine(46)-N7)-methyltransferase TrmB [Sutcliffiella sp. NC1]
MRIRNKPWASDFIAQNPQYIIPNPEELKGNWHKLFGNDNPIHIEVGTGKGSFITGMAKANPHINYIGIELFESVIVKALERVIELGAPNVKLLQVNAADLLNYFAPSEIGQVYLNFSDPWPKKRHEKRRLTYKGFLDIYKEILIDNGEIHFKTDNRGLFEFSLLSFNEYGLKLNYISLDLHKSNFEGNIMTEYEKKFSEMGQPIYRCEVQFV